jgi:deazaflavin-dependent oxidoreductase (nitroreductase family)
MRRVFWIFNKIFMVPMFQLGLGPFIGNKITGYIMVLKTIGRKTGKTRFTPVNYAIQKGNIFCISGWGSLADWYRNIMATREVEVILPSGSIYGEVDDVTDSNERKIIIRKILQNAGFAGYVEGFNPFTISDEVLEKKTANMPLVRIHPTGIGCGASDPGGFSFVWMLISIILLILFMVAIFK